MIGNVYRRILRSLLRPSLITPRQRLQDQKDLGRRTLLLDLLLTTIASHDSSLPRECPVLIRRRLFLLRLYDRGRVLHRTTRGNHPLLRNKRRNQRNLQYDLRYIRSATSHGRKATRVIRGIRRRTFPNLNLLHRNLYPLGSPNVRLPNRLLHPIGLRNVPTTSMNRTTRHGKCVVSTNATRRVGPSALPRGEGVRPQRSRPCPRTGNSNAKGRRRRNDIKTPNVRYRRCTRAMTRTRGRPRHPCATRKGRHRGGVPRHRGR